LRSYPLLGFPLALALCQLALGSAPAGASPASASPAAASPDAAANSITTVQIAGPTSIVVGTKDIKSYTVSGTVTTNSPTDTEVLWSVTGKGVCVFDSGSTTAGGGGQFSDKGLIDPGFIDSNDCAGSAALEVSAFDESDDGGADTAQQTVHLLRAARWTTFNVHPEPVRKGATITIDGLLQRASWDDHRYHNYTQHTAALQFRRTGGAYTTVKTLTSATGSFRTTAKQSVSGCWRYVFAGSSTTGAATSTGDCVTVH
jgi:hypothetical protein